MKDAFEDGDQCRRYDWEDTVDDQEPCRLKARIGNRNGWTLCADGIASSSFGCLVFGSRVERELKSGGSFLPCCRRDWCGVAVRFSVKG